MRISLGGRSINADCSPHQGYLTVKVDHVNYYVHELWAMHHGESSYRSTTSTDAKLTASKTYELSHPLATHQCQKRRRLDRANRWRVTWRSKNIASTRDKFRAWCIRKSMELLCKQLVKFTVQRQMPGIYEQKPMPMSVTLQEPDLRVDLWRYDTQRGQPMPPAEIKVPASLVQGDGATASVYHLCIPGNQRG